MFTPRFLSHTNSMQLQIIHIHCSLELVTWIMVNKTGFRMDILLCISPFCHFVGSQIILSVVTELSHYPIVLQSLTYPAIAWLRVMLELDRGESTHTEINYFRNCWNT